MVGGALVPQRGLEPWLLSTGHIIIVPAASTSQQRAPEPERSETHGAENTHRRVRMLDWGKKIKLNLLGTSSHVYP